MRARGLARPRSAWSSQGAAARADEAQGHGVDGRAVDQGARLIGTERSFEPLGEPGGRLCQAASLALEPFPGSREPPQDGVGKTGEPGAPTLPDGADGRVDGGERRYPVEDQDLVGGHQQVRRDPGVEPAKTTRRVARETRFEHAAGPERAIDELGRERAFALLELRVASELRVESAARIGAIAIHALEHARGQVPRARQRILATSGHSRPIPLDRARVHRRDPSFARSSGAATRPPQARRQDRGPLADALGRSYLRARRVRDGPLRQNCQGHLTIFPQRAPSREAPLEPGGRRGRALPHQIVHVSRRSRPSASRRRS